MINIGNTQFSFSDIGLFITDKQWIHPSIKQQVNQIIFVTSGNVYIVEDSQEYCLTRGDTLFLRSQHIHYGSRYSNGFTSFFWLHFLCNDFSCFPNFPVSTSNFQNFYLLKELLHYSLSPNTTTFQKDIMCANILLQLCNVNSLNNAIPKIVHDIFEWIRINANARLSVAKVAEYFNYTPEHITRLTQKYYNMSVKEIINNFVMAQAKNLLCNSNYSIKEISTILEFESSNSFVKFFKYHENMSPLQHRNTYALTQLNNNNENVVNGLLNVDPNQILHIGSSNSTSLRKKWIDKNF